MVQNWTLYTFRGGSSHDFSDGRGKSAVNYGGNLESQIGIETRICHYSRRAPYVLLGGFRALQYPG